MSAEFLFSFLIFFQVQIESIKESGFYKMLLEKYPEVAEKISDPVSVDPELQEIIDLTGLNFDDLAQFSITVEGLDDISNASKEGRSPKIGSEVDFAFSAKVKGELDVEKILSFLLGKIEEERGYELRKKVEKTVTKRGKSTSVTMPSELLDKTFSATDLIFSISQDGNYSNIQVGLPGKLEVAQLKQDDNSSLACVNAMAKDRQITLGLKVDPAVWERPEFNSQQQNPLFAGLANSVKGIREFGLSISFRDESLGLEICVNCKDTQSALGLWTVAQGGLGMAQLAMAQEGGQAPAILSRVKTQAVDKNVFVRVDISEEDLDELENMVPIPGQQQASGGNLSVKKDPLIGKKAPQFESVLLDGSKFKLENHKGKVVVLDFWATWCGPCVRALPVLIEKMSQFEKDELILLAVNQGETKKVISQFLKKKKLQQLNVVMDRKKSIGRDYKVQGIPKTVVIDQEGFIRHVEVGFGEQAAARINAKISKLLSK
jgi:thiol-disulfide isomerase/thioredoxin